MPADRPLRILFICLGNICRSPIAEGVFLHLANQRGISDLFVVDSAGTGHWHQGQRPDDRAIAAAGRHGVALPSCARQITSEDLLKYDLLICMDQSNHRNVLRLGADESKVKLLLKFDPDSTNVDVPDPYEHGAAEFDRVYEMVHRACGRLLDHLVAAKAPAT